MQTAEPVSVHVHSEGFISSLLGDHIVYRNIKLGGPDWFKTGLESFGPVMVHACMNWHRTAYKWVSLRFGPVWPMNRLFF